MLARLWWKEARLFLPIWAFLALASAGGQWLTLYFLGRDARTGLVAAMALGWTSLYAFAVGSAAFAGEREGKTLTFLDTLPVSRPMLWRGKVLFAVVSTLLLAFTLLGLAALSTDRWQIGEADPLLTLLGVGAFFLEILGWGLLCSALMENALAAAGVSVACALVASPMIRRGFDFDPSGFANEAPMRFLLAIATAAASAFVVTRPPRPHRGRETTRDAMDDDAPVRVRAPRRARPVRWWPPALRALAWETVREGWPLYWKLAIVVVAPAIFSWIAGALVFDVGFFYLLTLGSSLVAGVGAFGHEHRGRTNRFLAAHGASPGVVWLVKVAAWTVGLALLWLPLYLTAALQPRRTNDEMEWTTSVSGLLAATACAVLCGMMVRRGITAVVVSAALFLAVFVPQAALIAAGMMPPWWVFLTPAAIVGITRLWAYDWMLERPGLRRWARLGALLATAFGSIATGYVIYRVREIPETFPGFPGTTVGVSLVVPPTYLENQDAAPLYREADRITTPFSMHESGTEETSEVYGDPFGPPGAAAKSWLSSNEAALALIREATRLPGCQFVPFESVTLFSRFQRVNFPRLAGLLALSARSRTEAGDLDGAWDDILGMFRLARHASGEPDTLGMRSRLLDIRAVGLALRWSIEPKQTRERLRAAIASLRALPGLPTASEEMLRWAVVADRTLGLPRSRIMESFDTIQSEGNKAATGWQHFHSKVATTPWEVARARRLIAALSLASIDIARHEPATRSVPLTAQLAQRGIDLADLLRTTPIAQAFYPNFDATVWEADRDEVHRRALVQVLALRSWQLAHGGRLPGRLEDLIPTELDSLPLDPYSNQPFRYVVARGQTVARLGAMDARIYWNDNADLIHVIGARLLYSVGPNRQDDAAKRLVVSPTDNGDFVFPLADAPEVMERVRKEVEAMERAQREAEQSPEAPALMPGLPGAFAPPNPAPPPVPPEPERLKPPQ